MRKCDAPMLILHTSRISPLSCHLLERCDLSERIAFWLHGAAKHLRAWNHIRNDARLSADLRALTDPKMPGHCRLPAPADEIFRYG